MAVVGRDGLLQELTFGHPSPQSAVESLYTTLGGEAEEADWNSSLVARLEAYASGTRDDFLDVQVDLGPLTPFRRRVVEACRRIPFGETTTYKTLAEAAGSPAAARAVGRCMATNRIPLVIPCHRVVGCGGQLHGFSALGGLDMKRRLLEMERAVSPGTSKAPLPCPRRLSFSVGIA
jgi:methylated-DNA-[protein]-cysteine S-methyltransferase